MPTFPQRGAFTYRMDLDGDPLRLEFYWRPKLQAWYVDIFDGVSDDPIVVGRKVVNAATPLNRQGLEFREGVGILFVGADYDRQGDLGSKIEVIAVD